MKMNAQTTRCVSLDVRIILTLTSFDRRHSDSAYLTQRSFLDWPHCNDEFLILKNLKVRGP